MVEKKSGAVDLPRITSVHQVALFGGEDQKVLDISPRQWGVCFQTESYHSGSFWGGGWRTLKTVYNNGELLNNLSPTWMFHCAIAVQIGGGDSRARSRSDASRTKCRRDDWWARLVIYRHFAIVHRRIDAKTDNLVSVCKSPLNTLPNGPHGRGVAIQIAIVERAAITRCPDVDRPLNNIQVKKDCFLNW